MVYNNFQDAKHKTTPEKQNRNKTKPLCCQEQFIIGKQDQCPGYWSLDRLRGRLLSGHCICWEREVDYYPSKVSIKATCIIALQNSRE